MPRSFSPPPRVSDPDMHHGKCLTHVPWCMPGSLTNGFLWSQWRGKRSRHSGRMRNPQFYVSGKRPMVRYCTHRYSDKGKSTLDRLWAHERHAIYLHDICEYFTIESWGACHKYLGENLIVVFQSDLTSLASETVLTNVNQIDNATVQYHGIHRLGTEMCRVVYCGVWGRCIVGFLRSVY